MKIGPQAGFTVIEMMMVILVAAILVMVGVPSFTTFVINNRLTTEANSLVTTIQVARSEAVKRNSSIYIGSTSGDGDWDQGYVLFKDDNNNKTYDSNTDTVIRRQNALQADTLKAKIGGTAAPLLQFLPTGFTGNLSASTMTFELCHSPDYKGRKITVNSVGQVTLIDSCTCNSSNQCN